MKPVNSVLRQKSRGSPKLSHEFLDALAELSLPLQFAYLRRHYGVSQLEIAEHLNIKQAYVSRLEKGGSDHLISIYEKLAELLHCRLVLIPKGTSLTNK